MVNLLRAGKNALMLFSGTAARMVATFVFVIFSANHLGPEGFGKYSLVVHYFELFVSLTATATGILLIREIASRPDDRDKLISAALVLSSSLALVAPLLLIPLSLRFGYSSETIWGIGIACLGLIPAAIAVVYEAVFVAKERAEFVTVGIAIECIFRIGISILLLFLGYGIVALSMVLVFSRVVLAVTYVFLLRSICDHRLAGCRETIWQFTRRWRVFAAENWMATIYTNLDVIVLSSIPGGEAAVGLYSAAWRYVRLGTVAAKSFTTAIFPTMTRMHTESNQAFQSIFSQTFRVMVMTALPVIALVTVVPDRVVELLFKKDYAGSAPILQILIWALLLEIINPFLSHVLFSKGRQRFSMYVAAIGLAVNLTLMLLLVPRLGPRGAALACVITGTLATGCYLASVADLSTFLELSREFLRIIIAAVVMGMGVYFVREQSWGIIGLVSITAYGLMLLLVQGLRSSDLQFIKQSFRQRAIA
jgi:O-antigen/teichoic acid export membrane protein